MQGSSCCSKHFSRQSKKEQWGGRKWARVSEWVSAYWIKNLVSSCVDPHADSQLPACEAGDAPPPRPIPHLLSCCQGPSRLKSKIGQCRFLLELAPLPETVECLPSHNRCHLYPRRVGALSPPIQTAFYSPCPSVTAHFPASESAVRWNWATCHNTLRAWVCFGFFQEWKLLKIDRSLFWKTSQYLRLFLRLRFNPML